MSRRRIYIYSGLLVFVLMAWIFWDWGDTNEDFPERVKISLREVGNQLLLKNGDTTSLVLPVVAMEERKYKLSFELPLSFEPGSLVSIVDETFQKGDIAVNFITEVIQCSDGEVAYSYEKRASKEETIIACASRTLPDACYTIELRFIKGEIPFKGRQYLLYVFFIILIIFVVDVFLRKRKQVKIAKESLGTFTLGIFKFYPEQNKLVKEAAEINLSRKECELLEIFVANPNKIIKRDELTKKVWEDNGVIVGRSLDTYISKLRKKLQEDDSIKLTNVHGVGYKLEVLNTSTP